MSNEADDHDSGGRDADSNEGVLHRSFNLRAGHLGAAR